MKNYRNALIFALCVLVFAAAILSGCNSGTAKGSDDVASDSETLATSTADEIKAVDGISSAGIDPALLGIDPNIRKDSNKVGFQLEMPSQGDTVAVIRTNYGDITLRLFPEQAPKTVTNFINLANDGKYDNTSFHRVISDMMIQGGHNAGDPDDVNGVSCYGGEFEDEFCDKLFNIRGAVSMANSSKDSNGSQFFINQTSPAAFEKNGGWNTYDKLWENTISQLVSYKDSNLISAFIEENGDKFINTQIIPDSVKQLYIDNGGNPNFDGVFNAVDRGNTVFGQVIEGMDVVDKIAAAETDSEDIPIETVVIKSIKITTYPAGLTAYSSADTSKETSTASHKEDADAER